MKDCERVIVVEIESEFKSEIVLENEIVFESEVEIAVAEVPSSSPSLTFPLSSY